MVELCLSWLQRDPGLDTTGITLASVAGLAPPGPPNPPPPTLLRKKPEGAAQHRGGSLSLYSHCSTTGSS